MPVLDAKALKTDPKGLAFLRDVLRPAADTSAEKSVASQRGSSPRRKLSETVSGAGATR
jgi:hypothetical protein